MSDMSYEESDRSDSEWDLEEEDSDDQDILTAHAAATQRSGAHQNWIVMDRSSLARLQMQALEEVTHILDCPRSTARLLLMHHRWQKEPLFGAMAERGERAVLHVARVTPRNPGEAPPCSPVKGEAAVATEEISCKCCFCDVSPAEATSMGCGHAFCNDCWTQHFCVQIRDGNCRLIACMAPGCGAVCDDEQVLQLLQPATSLRTRFQNSLVDSFVDDSKSAKWCPSAPHCGRAVKVANGEELCEPLCDCGLQFCFACLGAPHSPCSCEIWRMWEDKTTGESETKHWVAANTKPCPKCHSNVEKISGCNLVTCRCGQHFCWLCGGATGIQHTYTSISGHTCGRYRDEADARIEDAQRNLKRFQFYEGRWAAHVASQRLEQELTAQIQEKIAKLEAATETAQSVAAPAVTDFGWLNQALQQLFLARRILGFSYVAAYYMFDGTTFKDDLSAAQCSQLRDLFEDAQSMLEVEVERLSKLIEFDEEGLQSGSLCYPQSNIGRHRVAGGFAGQRLDIINSTVNIAARLEKLYDFIEKEVLSQVSSASHYIAPYKGHSSTSLRVVIAPPYAAKLAPIGATPHSNAFETNLFVESRSFYLPPNSFGTPLPQ
mmetsp:Transcript_14211/g.42929  ORF Transcript_14211/g.42929 Transcript_14211/m.42929 type:complete len:605 (-) Transcript_14211:1274-3088(-)